MMARCYGSTAVSRDVHRGVWKAARAPLTDRLDRSKTLRISHSMRTAPADERRIDPDHYHETVGDTLSPEP